MVLGLAPGPSAHAARAISTEAADPDSGGSEGGPASPGTSERRNGGGGVKCTWKNKDGSVDTYKPGDTMEINGSKYKCGKDGKWHQVRLADDSMLPQAPEGGVYSPAP
jgi:hypothetical protein